MNNSILKNNITSILLRLLKTYIFSLIRKLKDLKVKTYFNFNNKALINYIFNINIIKYIVKNKEKLVNYNRFNKTIN